MPADKTVPNTAVIYRHILTLDEEGTAVNYHGIFITLATGTFSIVSFRCSKNIKASYSQDCKAPSAMTPSLTTQSFKTLGRTMHSMTTKKVKNRMIALIITILVLYVELSFFIVMLSAVMLNAVVLSVVAPGKL